MFNELKSLIKHSSVYGSANLLQKGIGFVMIPVYTHYLSPADYGLLELMELTINVLTTLMGMGLGQAIIRFYHSYENPQDRMEVFTTSLVFILLLCPVSVIVLEVFAKPIAGIALGNPDYYRYLQIMFIAMGLQTVAFVPESFLLAKKESILFSAISIGTLISYLSFNILFLVVFKMGILGILVSIAITKVLNTSSLLLVTSRLKLAFSFKKLRGMVGFGIPLVPATIGMFIMHFSDRFFVQKYCNLSDLGLYSLGYKFGMILGVIVSAPILRIWDTQRFEIAKTKEAKQVFGRMFTYYSLVVVFAGLGISVFIREIISIMAAAEYRGAVVVTPLIVLSYIFYGISNFLLLGITITNKTKYIAYIQLSAAAVNILLNMYLISSYGVMGAAVSTVLSFFWLSMFSFLVSQKLYPVPFEYGRVSILFLLALLIFGLSQLVDASLLMSLGIKSLLMIAFPVTLILGRFFYEDEMARGRAVLGGISSLRSSGRKADRLPGSADE